MHIGQLAGWLVLGASLGCSTAEEGVVRTELDYELSTAHDIALYTMPLELGTPEVELLLGIDTASANLLVGTQCAGCSTEPYDPAASDSATKTEADDVPLSFVSSGPIAPEASAALWQDVISLPDQPNAISISLGVIDTPSPYPLLLGLAGAAASELPESEGTAPTGVLNAMTPSLLTGIFSLSLCGLDDDNSLEMGIGIPADAQTVPFDSAGGFYSIDIALQDSAGNPLGAAESFSAVVDSGTPYIYLPADAYDAIAALVAPPLGLSASSLELLPDPAQRIPISLSDKQLDQLPSFTLLVGDVALSIEPRHYFRLRGDDKRFFGFARDQDDDHILGLSFLEGRTTYFDFTGGTLAFAGTDCND